MRFNLMAVAVGCAVLSAPAAAAPADEVRTLLEAGKAREAYQLGRSQPGQMGTPAFDFYYGIAALDAGAAGDGVLALERYLLSYPDNRSARYQLARGYFMLGEDQRARDEFTALAPAAAGDEKIAIDRFLDAVRARESRYLPTGTAYLEAGFGRDSNVNAGIGGGSTPAIPGLGNLAPLAENAISAKEGGSFVTVAGGAQGIYPVAPGLALYGAVGFDARQHQKGNLDVFDQFNVGALGGISHLAGRNLYKLGIGLGQLMTDGQRYVHSRSLNGEWHHQLSPTDRVNVGVQVATFLYDDMYVYQVKDKSAPMVFSRNSLRSSDYTGLSGGWSHVFDSPWRPMVSVAVNLGAERNRDNRPDLSRDIAGLRLGLALTPAPQWGLSFGLSQQESKYQGAFHPFAPDRRRDRYLAADAALSYFHSRNLTFRVEALAADQESNVGLYDYGRHVLTFKVRYDFK